MTKTKNLLLSAAFVLQAAFLFSASYTWNGSSSTSWSVGANWTPAAPAGGPGAFDNVTINGGVPFNPALTTNVSITNLTMNTGGNLNFLTFGLTITGNAALTTCTLNGSSGNITFNGGGNTLTSIYSNIAVNINANWTITNSTFNRAVSLVKSGGAVTQTSGGNTYNNTVSVINNTTGAFRFGSGNPDIFNSTSSFENQTTGTINLAYNSIGNIFNGNVSVASLVPLGFLNFGIAGGTSTLNPGVTILEGISGFLGGTLEIRNLTQLGTAITHSLDLTWGTCCSGGNLILKVGPGVVFSGNVDFTASNIMLNGGIYNGTTSRFTKVPNGSASSNLSDGGNVFNSPDTYITNGTTSTLTMAYINPDDYNGNAHFKKDDPGAVINIADAGINTFAGDIEIIGSSGSGLATPIRFGNGGGTVLLDGTGNQNFIRTTYSANIAPPNITRLTVTKASGAVFLNTNVDVLNTLTLNNGLVNTSVGNYMILNNGATTSLGSPSSYIVGPMIYKLGSITTTTLNFPIGKGGFHRPAYLSATHNNTTVTSYTAEVIHSSAMALSYTMPITLNLVSLVRYWKIDREAIGNLTSAAATLYYGAGDGVTDPANLRVAKTIGAGTVWYDMGGVGTGTTVGSITSNTFNTFSKFTLGNNIGGLNPLPIDIIELTAAAVNDEVQLNWTAANENTNDKYTVQKSNNAVAFEDLAMINVSGDVGITKTYTVEDKEPYKGISYYRLLKTGKNNEVAASKIISVKLASAENEITVFSNPIESELNFNYWTKQKSIVQLKVRDCMGNVVIQQELNVNGGNNTASVKTDNLLKGVYFLEIENHSVKRVKIIKL